MIFIDHSKHNITKVSQAPNHIHSTSKTPLGSRLDNGPICRTIGVDSSRCEQVLHPGANYIIIYIYIYIYINSLQRYRQVVSS